ncbi:hypothetical protein B0T24DRAFT_596524 [Lasiosphaeria ovina]|uniref:Cyclin N-terminal domain-containing protein n=1 Tax=Lasiosphaeria ovina TaxID=92902 RepID=A0AAE0N1F2_9PEZI|nr:hypothetical protein B0T24DRAFT_596524 [Lasiosphaeria ovina]
MFKKNALLKEKGENTLPNQAITRRQPCINWSFKARILNSLVEVAHSCCLTPDSLFLAVNLLDRYSERRVILHTPYTTGYLESLQDEVEPDVYERHYSEDIKPRRSQAVGDRKALRRRVARELIGSKEEYVWEAPTARVEDDSWGMMVNDHQKS